MDESPIEKIDEGWQRFRDFKSSLARSWQHGVNRRTLLIILSVVAPVVLAYLMGVVPPRDFPVGDIVTVSSGNTLNEVAQELYGQDVITSPFVFGVVVRILGGDTTLHSGDYLFKRPRSVFGVAYTVIHGYFGLEPVRIRIPEGTTAEEMAPLFARHLPRFDAEAFVEKGKPYDGYLYPDTYFFLPNATEDVVLATMRDTFTAKTQDLQEAIAASGYSLEEIVIIASLVEKEAHIYRDRRMIAEVIFNRLEIDMPLQIDAAFLYFLGKSTFTLTLKDLQHESPYNTYRYKGLPPGPITNPSYASLKATLTPIEHDYLFYLADYSGVTYYSETYAEHLRKKRLYLE